MTKKITSILILSILVGVLGYVFAFSQSPNLGTKCPPVEIWTRVDCTPTVTDTSAFSRTGAYEDRRWCISFKTDYPASCQIRMRKLASDETGWDYYYISEDYRTCHYIFWDSITKTTYGHPQSPINKNNTYILQYYALYECLSTVTPAWTHLMVVTTDNLTYGYFTGTAMVDCP